MANGAVRCRHGAQGVLDTASKSTLDNEFGTSNEDECMIKIMERGSIQETEVSRDSWQDRRLLLLT